MEFEKVHSEHSEHKEHGGGGGKSPLSLFKKHPLFLVGGLIVIVAILFLTKRNSSGGVVAESASGMDGYPTAGASGSGGATGISSDQIDGIQSAIGTSLSKSFNDQLAEVTDNLQSNFDTQLKQSQSQFDTYKEQYEAHDTQQTKQYETIMDQYQTNYETKLKEANDKVVDLTDKVDHLATTPTATKTTSVLQTGSMSKAAADLLASKLSKSYGGSGVKVIQEKGGYVIRTEFADQARAAKVLNDLKSKNAVQVGHVGAKT
jgi:uncharacterized membrane-anchored protein YhcB (DUF1043 family)